MTISNGYTANNINYDTLFYVSWTTFNFKINQLGTVSAKVVLSMPYAINVWIINKNYFLRDFKVSLTTVLFIHVSSHSENKGKDAENCGF